ncbi:MAG: UDP-N-acetylmuramate dehydrogenase [Planctomycetota bacterium]|nr:UDP-N-acetylmuramate dehydrogenase [Planctomycetota bacterium]
MAMELVQGLEHVVRRDEPLANYSWFRLGGIADYFAEPTNTDELSLLVRRFRAAEMPIRILGGGSNVLISRPIVAGLVIHLATPDLRVAGHSLVAGAGAKLGHVIATAVREGLGGLEALVGIPGTVGGALRRNAASQGNDIGQWTGEVTVMTREGLVEKRNSEQLLFGYGHSNLDEMAILGGRFDLEPGDPSELTRRMQKNWIVKRARQPVGDLGHGRIFADPHGLTASELVEQAGMRNVEQGGARVSDRDANFIVTQPGATSDDILRLIERIREQVTMKLGLELELQLDVWH